MAEYKLRADSLLKLPLIYKRLPDTLVKLMAHFIMSVILQFCQWLVKITVVSLETTRELYVFFVGHHNYSCELFGFNLEVRLLLLQNFLTNSAMMMMSTQNLIFF